MEGVTSSNGNGNGKLKHPTQIISFSINYITDHSYFMQIITQIIKLIKNLIEKL